MQSVLWTVGCLSFSYDNNVLCSTWKYNSTAPFVLKSEMLTDHLMVYIYALMSRSALTFSFDYYKPIIIIVIVFVNYHNGSEYSIQPQTKTR